MLFRGTRIVIPLTLRRKILEATHEGHPSIVAMKSRLRTKVWWPKIDSEAEKLMKSCKGCNLGKQWQAIYWRKDETILQRMGN